jgi:hypothetical protein
VTGGSRVKKKDRYDLEGMVVKGLRCGFASRC